MAGYASPDGVWRVEVVRLTRPGATEPATLLRVLKNTPSGLPLHGDGLHRMGPVIIRTGWWWGGDVPIGANNAGFMKAWAGVAALGVPLEDLEVEE